MTRAGRPARSQSRDAARRPLSRDRIVAHALDLIERDGLADFSTRRLGQALGVEAMALYHHFPSKADLLDALAEHLLRQVALPPEADPWRGWMGTVATRYRDMGLQHPEAFALLVTRRYRARDSFAFIEAALRVLTHAGFDLRTALRLTRTVGSFVNGLVLAEIAGAKGGTAARALPDGLPLLAKATRHVNDAAMDRTFAYGLDLILGAADPQA